MREIKFRAFCRYNPDIMLAWEDLFRHELGWIEHASKDVVTIMQFTGLKDKNGLDIYESDWLLMRGCADRGTGQKMMIYFKLIILTAVSQPSL